MLEIKKIKKVIRILDKEVKVLTQIKPFAIVMIITNIFVRHVAMCAVIQCKQASIKKARYVWNLQALI